MITLVFDLSAHRLTVLITEILQRIKRKTRGGRDRHQGFRVHVRPNIMYCTFILPILCTLCPTVVILVYRANAFRFLHAIYSMFHSMFLHAIYSMFHSMFLHQYSVCSSLLLRIYYIPCPSHPPCVKQRVNTR